MTYTYDLNGPGSSCLIIRADSVERELLRELKGEGEATHEVERDALESLICNSELNWVQPEEIGALTDAPILGLHGEECEVPEELRGYPYLRVTRRDNGKLYYEPVFAAWGFMDYALRSFVDDLIDTGKAVFTN